MIDPSSITGNCWLLAVYGSAHRPEASEAFFRGAVRVFTDLGWPPVVGGVTRSSAGKLQQFKRVETGLRRTGFKDVQSFEVFSTRSRRHDMRVHSDCWLTADYSTWKSGYAFVAMNMEISSVNIKMARSMAAFLIETLAPDYGFGVEMPAKALPHSYAIGGADGVDDSTPAGDKRARHVGHWLRYGMEHAVYRLGLLRDVYPWNYLRPSLLSQKVAGVTLRDWIAADPSRGEISPMSQGMVLWSVKKAQIARIRKVLWKEGLIFNMEMHRHLVE